MQHFQSPAQAAHWLRQRGARRLQLDSRKIAAGDAFLACPGEHQDGRQHIDESLQRGALACLIEAHGFHHSDRIKSLESCAFYNNLKADCGTIAAAYYDHPSHQIDIIAFTGTNGKTTCAWWLGHALVNRAQRCAMVGTLGMGELQPVTDTPAPRPGQSTTLTTPDAVMLQGALHDFVQFGVNFCVLEASSIGLAQGRLDGSSIRLAVFTNFTQDHLDQHGTMQAYWQAKQRLFDWPNLESAVLNTDDPKGRELAIHMRQNHPAVRVLSYGLNFDADLRAGQVKGHVDARGQWTQSFTVVYGDQSQTLHTPWLGEHNVCNLLAVIAALLALGHDLTQSCAACSNLQPVPGRMQTIEQPQTALAVIDYAHTPDALYHALLALRPLAKQRGGRLWCVFGCGGERDRSKRPLMGKVAQSFADRVVLTSDNPRTEDQWAIVRDIQTGFSPDSASTVWLQVQIDRSLAIAQTMQQAQTSDVVLIAGKGHESYQEVGTERIPYSDFQQFTPTQGQPVWQTT